ncbi:MAG: sugar transferase [Bacilli bacterium]|nr:sugar transferase [Bacilli bacterium]
MYRKYFKRILDITFSLIALILLLPVYIIIAILMLVFIGRPILFKQERPGKDEKIFNIYKFRTMTNKKDKEGNLLPDELRHTKFGDFLRRTSLDELPQMFNILMGSMSFIGPRPLLVKYLPYYTKEEHHRHDVRPGLTGLAQSSGRNSLSWDDKFKLDLEYVNNISFINDLNVILKTIKIMFKGRNINNGNIAMTYLDEVRKDKCKRK